MNSIIQKCITELDSPQPKLDYVKGLLEAALMMSGGGIQRGQTFPTFPLNHIHPAAMTNVPAIELKPEETDLVAAYEKGKIGGINT